MLSAIVVLFAVVVFLVGLHLYARWYVVRLRRRQLERRRGQRRVSRTVAADRGLDRAVLNSLPVFLHSPKPDLAPAPAPLECAVCISEFEEKEIVRLLPKCGHSFHIECIDMWFRSHSTCPLCRSPVEQVLHRRLEPASKQLEPEEKPNGVEPGSSSGSVSGRSGDGDTTPLGGRRKGLEPAGVMIEVPPWRAEPENDSTQNSPAGRLLSFKRILSMGRWSPATTSGASELDLESGSSESSRVRTPR
ncbi:RING-H2 finger protein atl2 [Phtheirospermum japonicum]|uniref:RING-type E3 ubiquitin transferase n=1 Tax=Phtheirospermum japonicum TaxID=374723 RepID=A0A830CU52_9LAMI|nr:RING-H2 finger protein atl2 [Phtheirospermum japonicum]